ncbi:MAG: helix-hairpin-helix domain-containing protein, partial [Candidatus Thermoplasmatota archaeon]
GWGQQTVDLSVVDGRTSCLRAVDLAIYGGMAALAAVGLIAAAWFLRRPRGGGRAHRDLLAVSGVTRVRARELEGVGIRGVRDLADADPEALSRTTSLSPKEARLIVRRAQEGREPKG